MKKVQLLPGIEASVLGFGCAPIMGSVGKEDALRAMSAAVEKGVNYFDIAPSYGFGEAEPLLGSFMQSRRRDDFVITTKFGIRATTLAMVARPLKGIVRALRGKKPSAPAAEPTGPRAPVAGTGRLHEHVTITADGMVASVHRSLTRLRTDHLDGLLLHEPNERITDIDSVLKAAAKLKQDGKIRAFGMAITLEQFATHQAYLPQMDFLQFNVPDTMKDLESITASRGTMPNVTFGAMRAMGGIRAERPGLTANEWLTELHGRFPNTVMLVSMFSPSHLESNCKLFS